MIKTVLVDDEQNNSAYVKSLLEEHFPMVEVTAVCRDAAEAVRMISATRSDLVFMDVEMPGLSGFSVLQQLEPFSFEVIFITAYSQYALQAFDVQAAGYLTKPLQVDKFIRLVSSTVERIEGKNMNLAWLNRVDTGNSEADGHADGKIALSTQNGLLFVNLVDILYCQSSGNYTKFFIRDGKSILVSRQLGEFERILPQHAFHRIHDQYLVHLLYIKEYIRGRGGELVLDNNETLPVSAGRKEGFLQRFEKWLRKS